MIKKTTPLRMIKENDMSDKYYELGMRMIEDTINSYIEAIEENDKPRIDEELTYMKNPQVQEFYERCTGLKDINWERRINNEINKRRLAKEHKKRAGK